VKCSDHSTLYVFPQVLICLQIAMIISCRTNFSSQTISDVFALDIKGLNNNRHDVINDTNDDKICEDMIVIGRGVMQGSVSSLKDYVFQILQWLPFYANHDLLIHAIAALVKLNKVLIIAIMHEYAYMGKDKTSHSSAFARMLLLSS